MCIYLPTELCHFPIPLHCHQREFCQVRFSIKMLSTFWHTLSWDRILHCGLTSLYVLFDLGYSLSLVSPLQLNYKWIVVWILGFLASFILEFYLRCWELHYFWFNFLIRTYKFIILNWTLFVFFIGTTSYCENNLVATYAWSFP